MLSPINTYSGMYKQKRFQLIESSENEYTIIDEFRERTADDATMLQTFVKDVLNANVGTLAKFYRVATQIDVSNAEFWLDMKNFIVATK